MIEKANNSIEAAADRIDRELIARARSAVSQADWTVGECAAAWIGHGDGRTDAAFGELLGMSADQIQKRRVVARDLGQFRDVAEFADLTFGHFAAARTAPDPQFLLKLAVDNSWPVSSVWDMRRGLGEDVAAERRADDAEPVGSQIPAGNDFQSEEPLPEPDRPTDGPTARIAEDEPATAVFAAGSLRKRLRSAVTTAQKQARTEEGVDALFDIVSAFASVVRSNDVDFLKPFGQLARQLADIATPTDFHVELADLLDNIAGDVKTPAAR